MTISANDAHAFPIYGARFRVTFPILDADGDLVTGATGLDSELSQDSGTFADATNEATEVATSSGMYFLDLISTETDNKSVAIIVKTTSSGAKTTPIVLNPVRLPVIRTGTAQAGAASTITLDANASAENSFYNGCFVNITNNSPANALGQARRIVSYVGSTKVATVEGTWGTNPSSASTFEILATAEAASLVAWGGLGLDQNLAAINLKSINVLQTSGNAVTFQSTGGNGVGLECAGNGSGAGIKSTGGASGDGIRGTGGSGSGNGISGVGSSTIGDGIYGSAPTDGAGISGQGGGAGNGIQGSGGSSGSGGSGLSCLGGGTDGDGIRAVGSGAGTDIDAPVIAGAVTSVGSVTGSVGGSVAGSVASVTGNVGGNVTGSVGSLAAQAKTDVNAEVLDVINTDTFAEPGQEAPGTTISLARKIGYLYKAFRNRLTQTATEMNLYNDDATTVAQKSTVSDNGTTYDRGEIGSGP
jgi:hypothetical protein